MHDAADKKRVEPLELRKANDCFIDTRRMLVPGFLFDEFWREGELALMFGASGSGKSILAMQIAEAIARGRKIDGFRMPDSGARVLYVDVARSESRFYQRYSMPTGGLPTHYRFSERLYRQSPPQERKIGEWLRETIAKNGVRIVIFDDLNSLANTADGTREMLAMMREMRKICDEMNLSMLAIASSRVNGHRPLSEADLMRSRILCDVADSVFAVGYDPHHENQRLLVQLRSWSAPLRWTWRNAPVAVIARPADDGFLQFFFDERFIPRLSDNGRQLIQDIKCRRDAGAGYREIADELGISKTRAHRLRKLWTPDMQPPPIKEPVENLTSDVGDEPDSYVSDIGPDEFEQPNEAESTASSGLVYETEAANVAPAKATQHNPFVGMRRSVNRRGGEILVEKEDETGNPTVWYGYNKAGRYSRFERTCVGISIKPYEGLALPP